jgi:hypothetical protein
MNHRKSAEVGSLPKAIRSFKMKGMNSKWIERLGNARLAILGLGAAILVVIALIKAS